MATIIGNMVTHTSVDDTVEIFYADFPLITNENGDPVMRYSEIGATTDEEALSWMKEFLENHDD